MREVRGAFLGIIGSVVVFFASQVGAEERFVSVEVVDPFPTQPVIKVVSEYTTYLVALKLVPEDKATYTQKVRVFVSKNGFERNAVGLVSMMAPSDPIEFDDAMRRERKDE